MDLILTQDYLKCAKKMKKLSKSDKNQQNTAIFFIYSRKGSDWLIPVT